MLAQRRHKRAGCSDGVQQRGAGAHAHGFAVNREAHVGFRGGRSRRHARCNDCQCVMQNRKQVQRVRRRQRRAGQQQHADVGCLQHAAQGQGDATNAATKMNLDQQKLLMQ